MGTESGRPSTGSESEEAAMFVSSLDREAIRSIALAARGRADLSCTVGDSLAAGSYNVVLSLDFSDGIRWAIRIPMEDDWTDLCAREMRLDVLAQQYIAARTTVPIPAIHAFSCTPDPPLGHPYLITDFAPGIPLSDVWDDADWWAAHKDAYTKLTVLESIARHMVALAALEFDRIGRLDCDAEGKHFVGPIPSLGSLFAPPPVLPEAGFGPFSSTQVYLRALIDAYWQDGNQEFVLLRLLLGVVPDVRLDGPPFTFAPPDFNLNNVLINPDTGEVSAFLDWDGVAIEPQQLGALGYPRWLLRDWNPLQQYPESTEEMHALRTFYADAVTRSGGPQCGQVTRNSHILATYAGAISEEMLRFGNLQHLGKLLFGSYALTYELLEGIERSVWLTAKPDSLLQVPAEDEDDLEISVDDSENSTGGSSLH